MPIEQGKIQPFSHLELLAKQVVEGFITGLHKSPFHGFSVEFAEHRLYNNGESTKHIDWKLFARSDKLFVKRYEEETNLRCQMVLDCSTSMWYPEVDLKKPDNYNKIKFSIYCIASIIQLLKKQRDAVGLSLFSDQVSLHTHAKSNSAHHKYLYAELEKLLEVTNYKEEAKATSVVDALHQIAESLHRRSLVILFSDMMDNSEKSDKVFSALQHLKHNKHEVILFHVADKKKEFDFDFDNRPYTFIDLESHEKVKITPSDVKKDYLASITEFNKNLKLKCGQYHIDFIEADINKGFNAVLLQYLIKRSKLY